MTRVTLGSSVVQRFQSTLRAAPFFPRALAAALVAVAIAECAIVGGAPGGITFLLCLAIAVAATAITAEPEDRLALFGAVIFALIFRTLVAATLEGYLNVVRPGDVFAGDESVYLDAARALANHWLHPSAPFDGTNQYLRSQYVMGIAGVFSAIGPNVLVIKLLNSLLGSLAPLFLYRTMRDLRMPSARIATVLLLFFPSLAFWSTLALKDAYIEFFVLGAVWTSTRFVKTGNYWWILATAAMFVPTESVRRYVFVILAIAWLFVPIALSTRTARFRAAVAIAGAVAVLFVIWNPLRDLGPNPLYIPILTRGSAARAGSNFVDPLPLVPGEPGARFQIAISNSTGALANATPLPGTTPSTLVVTPGTELVTEGSEPRGSGPYVIVRPGDVIEVASSSPVPSGAPSATPITVVLTAGAKNLVGIPGQTDPDATSVSGSALTNIRNLPLGMLYMALAPFPWAAHTLAQLATIPEMLLWYVCTPLAILGAVALIRRRAFGFVHGAAFMVGMFLALALVEANTGTLIRSRATIVPFVVALASVGMAVLVSHSSRLARYGWLAAWTN